MKSTNKGCSSFRTTWTRQSFSSRKESLISISTLGYESLISNQDKWSSAKFLVPHLSLISKLNYWSNKTQQIKCGFPTVLLRRYRRTGWSVQTITLTNTKYGLNLSKANTTVRCFFFSVGIIYRMKMVIFPLPQESSHCIIVCITHQLEW